MKCAGGGRDKSDSLRDHKQVAPKGEAQGGTGYEAIAEFNISTYCRVNC